MRIELHVALEWYDSKAIGKEHTCTCIVCDKDVSKQLMITCLVLLRSLKLNSIRVKFIELFFTLMWNGIELHVIVVEFTILLGMESELWWNLLKFNGIAFVI